jgi:hypothetical protein
VYTVHRLQRVRQRLLEPYGRLRKAVRLLRERYTASKGQNVLHRYAQLQKMIIEVFCCKNFFLIMKLYKIIRNILLFFFLLLYISI